MRCGVDVGGLAFWACIERDKRSRLIRSGDCYSVDHKGTRGVETCISCFRRRGKQMVNVSGSTTTRNTVPRTSSFLFSGAALICGCDYGRICSHSGDLQYSVPSGSAVARSRDSQLCLHPVAQKPAIILLLDLFFTSM